MPRNEPYFSGTAFWTASGVPLAAIVAFGGSPTWSWVGAEIVLTGALAVVVVGNLAGHRDLPWHPLFYPCALFGALVAAQWIIPTSLSPSDTFTALLQLAAGACAMYLSFVAAGAVRARHLFRLLWGFTGLLAAEAIVQHFTAGTWIYGLRDASYATPVGPFIYHNHFAGAMDLLIPIAMAYAFRPGGAAPRDALGAVRRAIVPALALAAVVISQSRGGIFALLFEGVLSLVVFWPEMTATRKQWHRVTLGAVVMAAFAALAGWAPLLHRLQAVGYSDVSTLDRLETARACLGIWRQHPVLGSGLDSFSIVYPAFEQVDRGLQFLHAHNDYAQALAETGLVGAGLAAAFLLILASSKYPEIRARSANAAQFGRKAILVGLGGFLFHAYGDFLFRSPADMLLFFSLAGFSLARPDAAFGKRRRRRWETSVVQQH